MRKVFVLTALALVGGLVLVSALLAVGLGATTAIAGGIFKQSDVGAHAHFSSFELTDDPAPGCGIRTDVDVNASEFDFQSPPGPGPGGGTGVGVGIFRHNTCTGEPLSGGFAGGEPSSFSVDERDLTAATAVAEVFGEECPFTPDPCEPLHGLVDLDWTGENGISTFRSTSHQTNPDGSKSNCHNVDKNRSATVAGTVDLDGNGFHGSIHFDGSDAEFAGLHSHRSHCTNID